MDHGQFPHSGPARHAGALRRRLVIPLARPATDLRRLPAIDLSPMQRGNVPDTYSLPDVEPRRIALAGEYAMVVR